MRLVAAAAVALVCLLLTTGVAVEAKPFPQTQNAVRHVLRETLDDADHDAAKALRDAVALVRALKGGAGGLVPSIASNGALDVRAASTQPVVRGHEDFLALAWISSQDEQPWTGAYWIEANGQATSPNVVTVSGEGALIFLDPGALPLADAVEVTYHFLGADGIRASRDAGSARVLDLSPAEERAELGLAVAGAGAPDPNAIIFTAWNTLTHDAELTITLYAGEEVAMEFPVADCDDFDATTTSTGCRLLYVLRMPEGFTRMTLSRMEGDARVDDVSLTLGELVTGYSSSL